MIRRKMLTVRVSAEEHRDLSIIAAETGMTIQAIVIRALDAWKKRREQAKARKETKP